MRVLLSAYGCEPNKGSEQEIGWQRALHMSAFADEVWVLTRSNNRNVIEGDPSSRTSGLHFIYYDLPKWALRLKKQSWFFPIYLTLWQWGAYRTALMHHERNRFDRVYHVTFTGMVAGSFMGRLGVPFIVGPIAGGERAPLALRRGMPMLCRLRESFRDVGIIVQRYSPLIYPALAAAERIFVVSHDSLRLIPAKWHSKTEVQLSVGHFSEAFQRPERRPASPPRFVFVGRLLHWKGVHFAIRALAEARRMVPAATLTLFGSGPAERWLRDLAKKCGVADAVDFAGQAPRKKLIDSLHGFTALVFPSLHDSGGLAVLEAMSKGLPVICLDLGGPGIMVNRSCGVVVPTAGADETKVVASIANAMIHIGSMPVTEFESLSRGAIARANDLTWDKLTERVAYCASEQRV
jgi:glycosyltransferase involved in cell wall biosynthesis